MKTIHRRAVTILYSLITIHLLVAAPAAFPQGSLTPPGPPAPTMKTLDQVEPRIAINATNTPGDADSLFKITQPGSYYLTGNITGESSKHGIEIAASGVTLDLNGFALLGVAGSLDGVNVALGLFSSIAVLNGSARSWGDEGVELGNGALNCRVEGVLASLNSGSGISAGSYCTVTRCSANDNGGIGISTSFGCTITGCAAGSNTGHGINTGTGCVVTNCSAGSNTGSGINVLAGSTVADCTARGNTLDGIVCSTQCLIRANTCSSNGLSGDGAGVHTTGADNRVESNNCSSADRGIDVDSAGNIIIRNTCAGNTIDWVIAANNVFGPIIDRRAPASAAVSGFAAASTLGSTDPNANFSY